MPDKKDAPAELSDLPELVASAVVPVNPDDPREVLNEGDTLFSYPDLPADLRSSDVEDADEVEVKEADKTTVLAPAPVEQKAPDKKD